MKVKIYPEHMYTLEINDQRFTGWKREGELEGIVKLTHPEYGVVLIDWPLSHMSVPSTPLDGSMEGHIIKGSPAIIDQYVEEHNGRT